MSLNGVGASSSSPWARAYAGRRHRRRAGCGTRAGSRRSAVLNTLRYSGYIDSDPVFSAWTVTSVGPMFWLRLALNPWAVRAWTIELAEEELLGVVLVADDDRRPPVPGSAGVVVVVAVAVPALVLVLILVADGGALRRRGACRRGSGGALAAGGADDGDDGGGQQPAGRCGGRAATHRQKALRDPRPRRHGAPRRAPPAPARPESGSSGPPGPSAVAISQSANHAFLGSSGPWR